MRLLMTAALSLTLLTGCSAGTEVADGQGQGVVGQSPDPAAGARIEGVQTYADLGREHEAADVDYPQSPPVGGTHWPPSAGGVTGWLACGVYEQPVPDEFAVHSLEHGAVWLTYGRDASPEQVSAVEELARIRPEYVLVAPYDGQDGAVGATAWGSQLFVAGADDPRLEQFVRAYAGGAQGGEPGAPCEGGASPGQAQAALDAAG